MPCHANNRAPGLLANETSAIVTGLMATITLRISDKVQTIALIALLAASCAWGVQHLAVTGFFVPKYLLRVYVPSTDGLAQGAPVLLYGMRVGDVAAMKPVENAADPQRRIELLLRIQRRFENEIRTDSAATLIPDGILGKRAVSVRRGSSGAIIAPGGEIPFVPARKLSDLVGGLKPEIDCLNAAIKAQDNKPAANPASPPSHP
jgi:ABC-type transporter Mla subunit MlaD